jgi:hypothetical protein
MSLVEVLAWLGPVRLGVMAACVLLAALVVYAEHRLYVRDFTSYEPGRHRAERGDR